MHGSEQDHGHHAAQEENNDKRVDYAEPLDLGVGHRVQYVVPARGPLDIIVLLVLDRERVGYGEIIHFVGVARNLHCFAEVTRLARRLDLDLGVHNTAAFAQERCAPVLVLSTVVSDFEVNVIENVIGVDALVGLDLPKIKINRYIKVMINKYILCGFFLGGR